MRRMVAPLMTLALLAGVPPGPAAGAERATSDSVNAFWYLRRDLTNRTYRLTVWYVGVYRSGEEIFSDAYRSVDRCRRRPGRDRCRPVSYMVGFSDLAGETYEVDRRLSDAHLDATYTLRPVDGEVVAAPRRLVAHVVMDLEGVGELTRYRETYVYRQGCTVFRYDFKGRSRAAEAHGWVNGRNIGETYDAWMSRGGSLSVEREC